MTQSTCGISRSEMKPIPPTTQERIAELEAVIRLIRDETNVLREDAGLVEVRAQRLTKWWMLCSELIDHREER